MPHHRRKRPRGSSCCHLCKPHKRPGCKEESFQNKAKIEFASGSTLHFSKYDGQPLEGFHLDRVWWCD